MLQGWHQNMQINKLFIGVHIAPASVSPMSSEPRSLEKYFFLLRQAMHPTA